MARERELRAALVDLRVAVGSLRSVVLTLRREAQEHQTTLDVVTRALPQLEGERDRLARELGGGGAVRE